MQTTVSWCWGRPCDIFIHAKVLTQFKAYLWYRSNRFENLTGGIFHRQSPLTKVRGLSHLIWWSRYIGSDEWVSSGRMTPSGNKKRKFWIYFVQFYVFKLDYRRFRDHSMNFWFCFASFILYVPYKINCIGTLPMLQSAARAADRALDGKHKGNLMLWGEGISSGVMVAPWRRMLICVGLAQAGIDGYTYMKCMYKQRLV